MKYSLRTLMIAFMLLAVALGLLARWREAKLRENRAGDLLLDQGGSAGYADSRPFAERGMWVRFLALLMTEDSQETVIWVEVPAKFTDEDLQILRDLPHVKTLHLDHVERATAAGLAPLRRMTQLEVVTFKETPVGDAGLRHLQDLHTLKQLWAPGAEIGRESTPWIASNRQLTHLDLTAAHIGDESLAELAQLSDLEVLCLGETGVTSHGLSELKRLPRLAHLYLRGTGVDDEGLRELAQFPTLRSLDIRRTATTAEGRLRFKRTQKRCRMDED